MQWLSCFFAGVLLTNAVPHSISGVLGRSLRSPLANLPGQGLSSLTVNLLLSFFNLVIGSASVCRVGNFSLRTTHDVLALALGILDLGLSCARHFSCCHGARSPEPA